METEAQTAVDALNNRWYAGKYRVFHILPRLSLSQHVLTLIHTYLGRPLYAELSPVTDFREACCRQNEIGECNRGGFCNFMHLRLASKSLISELKAGQRLERRLHPELAGADTGGWQPPSERVRNGAAGLPPPPPPHHVPVEEFPGRRRSASPPRERERDDRYRERGGRDRESDRYRR